MGTPKGADPLSAGIDEYLCKRLMPVEGAIPRLAGIDMYGSPGSPSGNRAALCDSLWNVRSALDGRALATGVLT